MNIFGQLLKEIRRINDYTQKDLATKLSTECEEFRQLDFVTISRWERGTTAPNNAKALRVLRCLTYDVRPFLSSLLVDSSSNRLDEFIQQRFNSNMINSMLAAFGVLVPTNEKYFRHDHLIHEVNDPILSKIKNYHQLFNQDRLDIFNIDLYLYQEEKKIHGYRFYDTMNNNDFIGHSLSFFMNPKEMMDNIMENGCDIDLKKSTKYRHGHRFAMYLASGIITSGELFKYHWKQQLHFLSTHSNITHLYISVLSESVVPFLMDIGFEVVATKNLLNSGGVKIGRRYYERCIMKIDTSYLLTNKEVLSLVSDSL